MSQYPRLFGTARIPRPHRDEVPRPGAPPRPSAAMPQRRPAPAPRRRRAGRIRRSTRLHRAGAVSATLRDSFFVDNGVCLVSDEYPWDKLYIAERCSASIYKRVLSQTTLFGLAGDNRTYGERGTVYKASASAQFRPLKEISGMCHTNFIALGGPNRTILRPGMGVVIDPPLGPVQAVAGPAAPQKSRCGYGCLRSEIRARGQYKLSPDCACVCVCVRACVRVCVCARARMCVRACVRACVRGSTSCRRTRGTWWCSRGGTFTP